jgi:hypothetical protein
MNGGITRGTMYLLLGLLATLDTNWSIICRTVTFADCYPMLLTGTFILHSLQCVTQKKSMKFGHIWSITGVWIQQRRSEQKRVLLDIIM